MQEEHDAALQSLDIAENLSSGILLPSTARSQRQLHDSASDGDTPSVNRAAKSSSKPTEKSYTQVPAAKTLLGKTLLAKASILKQLERTHEANECMKSAKKLDPAIGKYVRD